MSPEEMLIKLQEIEFHCIDAIGAAEKALIEAKVMRITLEQEHGIKTNGQSVKESKP